MAKNTLESYVKIGSEVSYLRHDNDMVIHREKGIVRAIFVDTDDRLMVQVRRGDNAFNAHYCTVNASESDQFVSDYRQMLIDIKESSSEGDKIVNDTVKEYNNRVKDLATDVMGEPITFDELSDLDTDEIITLADVAGMA